MPKGHLSELIHTNRRGYDGLSYEVILTPSQDEKQNRKESEEKKRVCMSCGRVFPDVSLSLSSSSRCRARRNILYVVDNAEGSIRGCRYFKWIMRGAWIKAISARSRLDLVSTPFLMCIRTTGGVMLIRYFFFNHLLSVHT